MIPQTYVRFSRPVTIDLRVATGPRPRAVSPEAPPTAEEPPHDPVWHEFEELPFYLHFDPATREIRAHLPPIPHPLPLYGTVDFSAAAADTMDDHAARVLQCLGSDPASVLQALCDGSELPPMPPRVPREIPNWRAKVILAQMGLLPTVNAAIAAMPEPDRTVVDIAWNGDAKLARRGKTVLRLAATLDLSDEQMDELFITAESIEV